MWFVFANLRKILYWGKQNMTLRNIVFLYLELLVPPSPFFPLIRFPFIYVISRHHQHNISRLDDFFIYV